MAGRDGDLSYDWGARRQRALSWWTPASAPLGIKFPVRDRAGPFTDCCGAVVTAAGRRVVRSPPQAPTGNAAWAPMTGTVRRGLAGRLLIAGEHHLRRGTGRKTCSASTPPGRTAPWAGCHRLTLTPGHRRPASRSTESAESRPVGGVTHDCQLAA